MNKHEFDLDKDIAKSDLKRAESSVITSPDSTPEEDSGSRDLSDVEAAITAELREAAGVFAPEKEPEIEAEKEPEKTELVKVVPVRLYGRGVKRYYLLAEEKLHRDDFVLVEYEEEPIMGRVESEPFALPQAVLREGTTAVIRRADEADLAAHEENIAREVEAFKIASQRIREHNLEMNLVDVELLWNHSRLVFYFTADGRVDFRDLVKDLAAVFKMRIDLRQIGVRDEAKMLGALGICGRELCCSSFLQNFEPVSIKMAKLQNLSMKPSKISGACGRLLCCLKYEEEAYQDLRKRLPRKGEHVMTPAGEGRIEKLEILKERVIVRLLHDDDADPLNYSLDEVDIIRRPKK
ncbi:MAG: regulatory iron-sulfur-containing complex subunit RicT [Eubacteriales bacterium]|nr:regulatory iron-sulfur-containing complex subunit RicT [Eubacteriales bacterium]